VPGQVGNGMGNTRPRECCWHPFVKLVDGTGEQLSNARVAKCAPAQAVEGGFAGAAGTTVPSRPRMVAVATAM
jgi:hypothetical protein